VPATVFAATGAIAAGTRLSWDEGRLMSTDELARLASLGVEIGAHTRSHPNLRQAGDAEIREEVEGSRDDVLAWTGSVPAGFAYPFGIPRLDLDRRAIDAVRVAGFEYAVVNQPVPVTKDSDRFALPRVYAPDLGGAEFRTWLRLRLGDAA
jgi:peptidoglycan/xylan/chitin deacetylase (PgdA/CDA1 family)